MYWQACLAKTSAEQKKPKVRACMRKASLACAKAEESPVGDGKEEAQRRRGEERWGLLSIYITLQASSLLVLVSALALLSEGPIALTYLRTASQLHPLRGGKI